MRRNFIVDQEIKLFDGTDFLNTKVYSDALQKMVQNAPAQKPFTIGLFGEWGSGKSSIIKTAKEDFENKTDFKVKFAVFDAWKYSEDAFRRSFILSLLKELNITLPKQEYNLYENQTQRINEFKIKISARTWIILGLILVTLLLVYGYIPWVKTHVLALVSLISLYLISSTIFISLKAIINKDLIIKALNFIQSLVFTKYDEERPLMFSPEQFSKAFEHIVDKATIQIDRLVIVIDNIDRCEKNYATELLSTIKGFLESREKVLFILPVDETALKRHIRETHKADDKEADEFLRKFFNTTLRIKPYVPSEIYEFAKQINDKFHLDFSDYTLDLVSKEYASNPRRIIQMFNNLSAELECFSDDLFVKSNETIICKLLIVREEFPQFYYYLSKNPYLLGMSNDEMKAYLKRLGGQELERAIWNQRLENFLNKTKIITEGTSIKELNQILSNSIVFSALPTEIETFIENLQYNEVKNFIDNDSKKLTIVVDFLIQQLYVYNERSLFGNSFINNLSMLIEINKDLPLSKTINMRIEEIIKPILHEIYSVGTNLGNLIEYSWSLASQQRTYLMDSLITKINAELTIEKPAEKWTVALSVAINTYSDKNTLRKLSNSFKNVYKQDARILDKETLKPLQLTSLIDSDLYSSIIEKIVTISSSDPYYQDLSFILFHNTPSVSVETEILAKINELNPAPFIKNDQEYTDLLVDINNLLIHFKMELSNKPEQLQILVVKLWGEKKIPHPSYPEIRQHDTVTDYVSDVLAKKGDIDVLLDFCINIYRLTLNNVNIIPTLIKIKDANIYQESINSRLIELINKQITIDLLYGFILTDTSYTADSLNLIKSAFIAIQHGPYVVSSDVVVNKLNEILALINTDDSRKEILMNFLEDIIDDARVRELLLAIIPGQSKEDILKLSKPLQSLAIDRVLEAGKIFEFSNNLDFLKVIAQTGDEKHIGELVNDIISKLQHADQFENAISIILEIANISKTDANRIVHELENKRDTENKDEIKDVIKQLKQISSN